MSDRRGHDELDRLLHGEEPAEHAALSAFLREVQEGLREAPSPSVAEQHLAAITAAAAEAAHSAPTAATEPANSPWRGRVRRLAGLTAFKVAIGVSAAAAATGTGLATTGNLPDPMQRAVASVVDRIGIELPVPDTTPPAVLPDEAPSTIPPREVPGPDDDTDDGRQPTPARPEGGAPPAEVPGDGEPPTVPPERASDRDRDPAGDDEIDPPSRRPDDAGRDADDRAPDVAQERDQDPADAPAEGAAEDDAEEDGEVPDAEGEGADAAGAAGATDRVVPLRHAGAVPARSNR